jgi:hypothetical protein
MTVSWFEPQNQAGFGSSVVPQKSMEGGRRGTRVEI